MMAAVLLGMNCSLQATETVPPPSMQTPQKLLIKMDRLPGNACFFDKHQMNKSEAERKNRADESKKGGIVWIPIRKAT